MHEQPIPAGYCHCGCGGKTSLAARTISELGLSRGDPRKWIVGHQQRGVYRPIIPRLESRSRLTPEGCWEWFGAKSPAGYGTISWLGRDRPTHRVAYELLVGPVPDGLQLDHLCRNRACLNPEHLEPVTNRENTRRGLLGVLKTHCKHGHEYTTENTRITPEGKRVCRICHRGREAIRQKARRATKRTAA